MLLISWNIRLGGGDRIEKQVNFLESLEPDILAIQEVKPNTAPLYKDCFGNIGLRYTANSFDAIRRPSRLKGPRRLGVLIASRWPLVTLDSFFNIPWPEKALSCIVNSPSGDIELHSTYVPPGCSNDSFKRRTLEGLYSGLSLNVNHHRILCGDFNCPQLETKDGHTITWGQRIKSNGDAICIGRWGKRWDAGERNILVGLAEYDLPDIYRKLNGIEKMDYSWYSRAYGNITGRRFDHVFASNSTNAQECKYLHNARKKGLSDHSPIQVLFKPDVS